MTERTQLADFTDDNIDAAFRDLDSESTPDLTTDECEYDISFMEFRIAWEVKKIRNYIMNVQWLQSLSVSTQEELLEYFDDFYQIVADEQISDHD